MEKGGSYRETASLSSFNFFFHFFIMTHLYNTKYLDQEQGFQDTKSTFIAGHKDK